MKCECGSEIYTENGHIGFCKNKDCSNNSGVDLAGYWQARAEKAEALSEKLKKINLDMLEKFNKEEIRKNKIVIEYMNKKEKAEAELTRIMAIIEKNPYPETVFKKITDEEFIKIHEILQREMNMPIDRLSGEYMRMLRKQIMREIKES